MNILVILNGKFQKSTLLFLNPLKKLTLMFKILLSKLVLLTLLMLRMPCFALEAWAYFIEQARQLSLDNCCLEYVDKLIYSSLSFQISHYFLIKCAFDYRLKN